MSNKPNIPPRPKKGTARAVRGVYGDGRIYMEFRCIKEASAQLQCCESTIYKNISGKSDIMPAGLNWEFLDDPRITKGLGVFA